MDERIGGGGMRGVGGGSYHTLISNMIQTGIIGQFVHLHSFIE